jgi:D-3-phosphoglycerate dehydrogenase
MKVLHLDSNHPLLLQGLQALGFENEEDYSSTREEILGKIQGYQGLILRSRTPIDQEFLDKASDLKFIGRVGAGLENIDTVYAEKKGVFLASAPEGNRNAVGEHALAMLLALFNKLRPAHESVGQGQWLREAHRGAEIEGKTVGIIGYGNMGNSFAKKLQGFDCEVLCFDLKPGLGNEYAKQVSLEELQERAHILSLHTPQTPLTKGMVNKHFLTAFSHPIWLINTARGSAVVTEDLVEGLQSGQVLGAGLDVLEYEKASFENLFESSARPAALNYLLHAPNVLISPHVAGWTVESHEKLAQTIVDKIKRHFSYL